MSEFTIENLTNASIVIKSENEKLVIDPWFTDGIYLGTWYNFPKITEEKLNLELSGVDVCMYTHLHKDHFDIQTANRFFDKNTKFLIPKVFGWQVISGTLQKNGFHDINVMECSIDTYETSDFKITAVPPLNVTGLEAQDENNMSIDGGFALINKSSGAKCVFLADDNLYSEKRVKENLDVIADPDLIAFAYSGFASDYPFKYNMTKDEMIDICNRNENERFATQVENLRLIKPKFILPYSSEFVAVGNHAQHWRNTLPHVWTSNKAEVASRYAEALGVHACALYPNDYLGFDQDGELTTISKQSHQHNEYSVSSLISYAESLDDIANYKAPSSDFDLPFALEKAARNVKGSIEKFSLKPKQHIIFRSPQKFLGAININGDYIYNLEVVTSEPYLEITIDAGILAALLNGDEHWDDACLSMRLSWKRVPNHFCGDTMNALYYTKL